MYYIFITLIYSLGRCQQKVKYLEWTGSRDVGQYELHGSHGNLVRHVDREGTQRIVGDGIGSNLIGGNFVRRQGKPRDRYSTHGTI